MLYLKYPLSILYLYGWLVLDLYKVLRICCQLAHTLC